MATSKILDQLALRLPDAIRPTKYLLRLHPNLHTKIFAGNVTIRLELLKPIAFIPVHSKSLEVSTQKVVKTSSTGEKLADIKPSLTFMHSELEYWVTEFEKPLDNGNYELSLEFKGSLRDKIVGFYQSNYFDSTKSQKRWIATTKFEPTYARHAFPCFDEPALKATFKITVVCPNGDGYHALSNMNVEDEKILGDVTEVTFVESVPMSTYLACFIVSDFAHKAKMVKGSLEEAKDFEMRVFSTAAQLNKVSYALDIGAGITEYYIKYFNVPYPLPKLDMAAIPDFVSGAMEHWGLVTYRETALLYDEAISSCEDKQLVAKVVAHELAHMWFGNLVTMKWWNDLWLNEGFASYIEYKGMNEVHPDWQMLDQFLIGGMHEVMRLDATLASHPIVQTVHTPSQITELFDTITYSKGAAIIRMLEDMVGAEKFRNATQSYLKKFCYQNAETNDFLNEIEAQEFDFDVKLIMRTWTEQMGLPVLEVVAESDTTFKLTQNRFLCNPLNYKLQQNDSPFKYCWSIPVTYFTSADSEVKRVIFNYNDLDLKVTVPSVINWIKFNKNQMGYYLVNYPAEMWRAFTATLMSSMSSFSVSDRVHLLSDAFFLADASQLDYSIVLDLTKYLELERDYVPWYVAHSRLDAIRILLWSTDLYHDFELYVRQLVNALYESLTWNVSDDHMQNMLRVTILSLACRFGHPAALEEAGARFNAWLSNPTLRPHPDLRDTVYYYGMQVVGGEQAWNQVWNLFIAETDAQEKVKLMQALSAIKEPQILQRYINMAWNEDNVRRQDYFSCLKYISKNQIGQYLVWDYVRENWLRFVDRFGINERYLGRLIPAITAHFATRTKLEEMEALFTKYPVAGAGTTARKEALERVKCNIQWLEENMSSVGRWFLLQKGDGDESQQE